MLRGLAGVSCVRGRASGQSLIESCIVVALLCLILFGLFQVSQLYAVKETLIYAAGRGLRAKTVGFNRFMVHKTIRVGAIPAAGRLTNPTYAGGPSAAHALEEPRIPLYLGAEQWGQLSPILDYEHWDAISYSQPSLLIDGVLHMHVSEDYPLRIPFHRTFYDADDVNLSGESYLDNHCDLYLDDMGL